MSDSKIYDFTSLDVVINILKNGVSDLLLKVRWLRCKLILETTGLYIRISAVVERLDRCCSE